MMRLSSVSGLSATFFPGHSAPAFSAEKPPRRRSKAVLTPAQRQARSEQSRRDRMTNQRRAEAAFQREEFLRRNTGWMI